MAEGAKDEIKIMGHHLLPLFYCFSGRDYKKRVDKLMEFHAECGYGESFIDNFNNLFRKIANNPELRIKLVDEFDDICEKCPKLKTCGGANNMDVIVIKAFDCDVNGVYTIKELIKKGFGLLRPHLRKTAPLQRNKLSEWQRNDVSLRLCAFLNNGGVYELDENLLETK